MYTTLTTSLYVALALCVIGVGLLIFRFITQWKKREEVGEAGLQRTLTFTALLIGLAVVLGFVAHFVGSF